MTILAVDDERAALAKLVRALQEAQPGCEVQAFSGPDPALDALSAGLRPDSAFLDIEMYGVSGLELAKRIKELSPKTRIIFVTAYSEYALDAFSLHATGYLLKPATAEGVRAELDAIAEPAAPPSGRLSVKCFGNFEVFFEGKPLVFPRSRSKELLAYLIHKRGGSCTIRELAAVLFEDKAYTPSLLSQMQTLVSILLKTLDSVGARAAVIKKFNSLAVDMSQVDCDLYRFLDGDIHAINAYLGEYMANYSWAAFLTGYLDERTVPR